MITAEFVRKLECDARTDHCEWLQMNFHAIADTLEEYEQLVERMETGIRDLLRENERRAQEILDQNKTIIALIGERVKKGAV